MANLNKEPHPRYFRIHRATHRLPDRSNLGSVNPRTGNDYSKVTADALPDLIAWAKEHIPTLELNPKNFCKTCNPDSDSPVESAPTKDPAEYVIHADQILARGYVARPTGVANPKVEYSPTAQYYRDPKVRAWVLQRADGKCELCKMAAPFLTDHDEPYLESHHIFLLAQGGPDTPENTAALCPNCHRRIHHGKDRADLCKQLTGIIRAKEAASALKIP